MLTGGASKTRKQQGHRSVSSEIAYRSSSKPQRARERGRTRRLLRDDLVRERAELGRVDLERRLGELVRHCIGHGPFLLGRRERTEGRGRRPGGVRGEGGLASGLAGVGVGRSVRISRSQRRRRRRQAPAAGTRPAGARRRAARAKQAQGLPGVRSLNPSVAGPLTLVPHTPLTIASSRPPSSHPPPAQDVLTGALRISR